MSSGSDEEFSPGVEDINVEYIDVKGEDNNGSNSTTTSNNVKRHIACALCRKRKLKCDGKRPKCATCLRQNHVCEYTETFRKAGPRRGYVKTLEHRVSQLEKMLADARTTSTPMMAVPAETALTEDDGDNNNVTNGADSRSNFMDIVNNTQQQPNGSSEFVNTDYMNMQLSELNMDEQLPPNEIIQDLLEIYFSGLNKMIPMIDKTRYMTLMSLGPSKRPKLFLQYAIFLNAAGSSNKYSNLAEVFYKRACKYMHRAETSAQFKEVANVQYVQAAVLLSTFEYKNALFPQAWLRVGSCLRGVQMLNMHVVDVNTYNDDNAAGANGRNHKSSFSSSSPVTMSDSAMTDEIRRTFWSAFLCDRSASSGTGWPCIMQLGDIFTKIPLEDELFFAGKPSHMVTIEYIFDHPEIIVKFKASRFLIYILYSECQYEIAQLIMFPRKDHDLSPTGKWMSTYRRIDNLLSSLIFVLDPVSTCEESERNLLVNLHLMVHTAILCLHKCALLGIQNAPELVPQFNREELQQRCANSAAEITLLIRTSKDISTINSHPILTFMIYTCARFFLTAVQSGAAEYVRFKSHLDFLITTLRIMRIYMPMAQMFCDSIIAAAGEMYNGRPISDFESKVPDVPRNCIWPEPDIPPPGSDSVNPSTGLAGKIGLSCSINMGNPVSNMTPNLTPVMTPINHASTSSSSSSSGSISGAAVPSSQTSMPSSATPASIAAVEAGITNPVTSSFPSSYSPDTTYVLAADSSATAVGSSGGSSYMSSGLTPAPIGTPSDGGGIGARAIPGQVPNVATPGVPLSGFQAANNFDWTSLMTTEAMWNEILASSGSSAVRNTSTEEIFWQR